MKLSKMAITVSKERSNSLECLSQKYFSRAGLVCRYGTGIYAQDNILVRAQENVKNVIRSVLDKYDCVEVQLPILQPKSIWEKSGRWEPYISSGKTFFSKMDNGSFVMAPTAEEAMLTFVMDKMMSYKDLPVNFYQIGTKFRNELRSRGGLLRSKEFLMMDAYSFHSTEDSLKEEYERMKNAYFEIFSTLGLHAIPVGALNGNMGGKVSEEFMIITEIGEDIVLVNEAKDIAFNLEVLEESSESEILKKYGISNLEDFEQKRCIELGHVFQLGQTYSKTMGGNFVDSDNSEKPFYMGCYGIGVSRLLATICEQNCDDSGLCWPENIAPYQIMIIYNHDKSAIAEDLYSKLLKNGVKVILDDRTDKSLGSKIQDWKILGIPYMVIIGNKHEEGKYETEKRSNGEKTIECLESLISKFGGKYHE
ncbi:MAG: hypothetical protein J6J60_10600 [Clostridia bacterium]|nr:hypothetical protein [Clostridia bacterium]MBP3597820.1 hypothetical protein [Clostridia bacterium]